MSHFLTNYLSFSCLFPKTKSFNRSKVTIRYMVDRVRNTSNEGLNLIQKYISPIIGMKTDVKNIAVHLTTSSHSRGSFMGFTPVLFSSSGFCLPGIITTSLQSGLETSQFSSEIPI